VNRGTAPAGTTSWKASNGRATTRLGTTPNGGVGPQGIAPTATELKPLSLTAPAPAGTTTVTASVSGTAQLDAILIQPLVSHLGMTGSHGSYDLYVNGSTRSQTEPIAAAGRTVIVSSYDSSGRLVSSRAVSGSTRSVPVAAGGFTTVQAR